jgi:hypothetical protein
MEKQAAQDYTMAIMEKIAGLQQAMNLDDKNDIIAGYYDLADSVIQLEDALIDAYQISEEDIDEFEKNNFLQIEEVDDVEVEDE